MKRDQQMRRAVRVAAGERRRDRSETWIDLACALAIAAACILLMWGATR